MLSVLPLLPLTILLLFLVAIVIICCSCCYNYYKKETFTEDSYNGFAFFQRDSIPKNFNYASDFNDNILPYNGYEILTKTPDESHLIMPDNADVQFNVSSNGTPKGETVSLKRVDIDTTSVITPVEKYLSSLDKKTIGTISVSDNSFYRIKGQYRESDFTINKDIKEAAFPGTTGTFSTESVFGETEKKLPDEGYIDILKDTFIKFVNKDNNLEMNFIALNTGKLGVQNDAITRTKRFSIPFFIYESKFNYTKGIVCVVDTPLNTSFTNTPGYITLVEVLVNDSIKDYKHLDPATKYDSIFEKSIVDTTGYFELQNKYGLTYPFKTSKQGIYQPRDPSKFFTQISESDVTGETFFN